jgi:hypothetical protein
MCIYYYTHIDINRCLSIYTYVYICILESQVYTLITIYKSIYAPVAIFDLRGLSLRTPIKKSGEGTGDIDWIAEGLCMLMCVLKDIYTYMYIYMYIYTHVCIHIYIYR